MSRASGSSRGIGTNFGANSSANYDEPWIAARLCDGPTVVVMDSG